MDIPLSPPSTTPLSKSELKTRIAAAIPDNQSRAVSAEDVRSRLFEMVDSLAGIGEVGVVGPPGPPGPSGTGFVTPRDFGAVGNGVTDDYAAFTTAFAALGGTNLFVPAGTWLIDITASGRSLSISNDFFMHGEPGATLLVRNASGGTRTLFSAYNANITLRDFAIHLADGTNGNTLLWSIGNNGSGLVIDNVDIDGRKPTVAGVIHCVSASDLTNFSGLTVSNCEWHHINRVWLKTNTASSTQSRLKFVNNYFHDCYAEPLALNTPSGVIDDVLISGNRFANVLTGTTATAHIAIGSAENVRVLGNRISGPGSAITSEEKSVNQIIANNQITLTEATAFGIRFLDNDIGGDRRQPYNIVVEGNTLKGPGQAAATTGCNGIWLVNDATAEGPGNRVLITNNVIEGFDRGIALDDEVPIFSATGNLCIDCNYGIQSPVAFESVKNNQFDTCDYGLYSSVAGPWGGGNTFLSVTTEVGNDTDTRFSPLTLFDIQKFTMFDDFDGDVLRDQWNGMVGSDPACVLPTILSATGGGVVRLRSGASAAATMAANGCQLDYYLQWNASFGGLLMQVRFRMSAIAGTACFVGLTDQIGALEMPFTIAAGNVFTSNATDAVGLTYNTGGDDPDKWWLSGVKADVDATHQNTGISPAINVFETWRIEVNSSGTATFKRNGVVVGTPLANAVSVGTLLTPVIAHHSRAAASQTFEVDYVLAQRNRF